MTSGKYLLISFAIIVGILNSPFVSAIIKELAKDMRDKKTGKRQPIQIFR